jgi:hypothetical protein
MAPLNALSGSLRDLPVADLLSFLWSSGRTGVVEFRGTVPGFIALDEGLITLAVAGDGPSLEEVVVGSGITSIEGFEQAQLASERGVAVIDALIRRGADAYRLESVLREQTVGALFEFVLPSDTDFVFLPGAYHPIGSRFRFSPDELVHEATRRIAAWRQIADAIPSTAIVVRLCPEAPEAVVQVTAEDWRVLARIDGLRTIAELIRALGMSAFAVCAVIHRLMVAGIVEPVGGWEGEDYDL